MENNNKFINNNIPPIWKDQIGGINDRNKAFIPQNNQIPNFQQNSNNQIPNFQQNSNNQIPNFQQNSNNQIPNFQQNSNNQIPNFQQNSNNQIPNFQQNSNNWISNNNQIPNFQQNPNNRLSKKMNIIQTPDNKLQNRLKNRLKNRNNNENINKNLTIEELSRNNWIPNFQQNPNNWIPNFQQNPNSWIPNFQQNPNNWIPNFQQNPNSWVPNFKKDPKNIYIPPYDEFTKNIINVIFLLFSGILIFDLYQIIILNNWYFYSIFSNSLLNSYSYIPTSWVKSIITIILTILVFSLLIFFPFILNNKLKNIVYKNTEDIVLLFQDLYKKNFENIEKNKEYWIKIMLYIVINIIIVLIYHYILKYLFIKPWLNPIKVLLDWIIVVWWINFYTNILYYFSNKTFSKNITESRKNINLTIITLLLYSIWTMLFLELLFYLSNYWYSILSWLRYIKYFL